MKTVIALGFGEEISVCWIKYKLSERKKNPNCQTVSFEQMCFVSLQIASHKKQALDQ